jgi:hypothetical protein
MAVVAKPSHRRKARRRGRKQVMNNDHMEEG